MLLNLHFMILTFIWIFRRAIRH